MNHDALMFEFRSEEDTRVAADTLDELGYEPHLHGGTRLHIHVRNEDLISALEIAQCHGGQIVQRAPAEIVAITDEVYGMDSIAIPAHTVNEDWEESYRDPQPDMGEPQEPFPADDAPYNRFDAT